MIVLSIDSGTRTSGIVRYDTVSGVVLFADAKMPNEDVLKLIADDNGPCLALEVMESYGAAVGREVFETCEWIGRFQQAWHTPEQVRKVSRRRVKRALGLKAGAKDGDVRRALIKLLGEPGKKSNPGPTYGVTSHAWSALGVAIAS